MDAREITEIVTPADVLISSSHKTVVVLNHSSAFAVRNKWKMGISLKDPKTGQMRVVTSVDKSFWTCSVECSLEFHRIVEDIYPNGTRLLRFVVSDFVGRFLNPKWGHRLIALDKLLTSLSSCGSPKERGDASSCSLINGISMAVDAISELSAFQKTYLPICYSNGVLRLQQPRRRIHRQISESDNSDQANNEVDTRNEIHCSEKRWKEILSKAVGRERQMRTDRDTENVTKSQIPNTGAIVIFTAFTSDAEITEIQQQITDEIIARNKMITGLDGDNNFAQITHVRVYLINLETAISRETKQRSTTTPVRLEKVNEYVSCCVIRALTDNTLRSVVHGVILDLYDLTSTTVTSIPMKEEAQQGQSVNYDVEVFHPKKSHVLLKSFGIIGPQSSLTADVSCGGYSTIKLSWSTPSAKNRWNKNPRCVSAMPITPANVNSRPSVCLTSFLLAGRNVMLEIGRSSSHSSCIIQPNVNQKLISHLLICHASRIYIHTIEIGDNGILDNPTFMSAAVLKNDQIFRHTDFALLMNECQLRPSDSQSAHNSGESLDFTNVNVDRLKVYNEQSRRRLMRITRYWPLRLTDTFIFNIPKRFDPVLSLIRLDELNAADVNKCRESICSFMTNQNARDPLTTKSFECSKIKNMQNREEQFRVAKEELLSYLRNYANHSDAHLEIFNFFLQISGLDRSLHLSTVDVSPSVSRTNSDSTLPIDSLSLHDEQTSRSRSNSRSSSPLPKRYKKSAGLWKANETVNLQEYFLEKYARDRLSKWRDFSGLTAASSSKVAVLYGNHSNKVLDYDGR